MDTKIVYKAITDVWQFLKKYLANMDKSGTDVFWDELTKESNVIYLNYKKEGDNIGQFVRSIVTASIKLIESEYKNDGGMRI